MPAPKSFVVRPIKQPLGAVPKHHDIEGLTRWLLLGASLDTRSPLHVALHLITDGVAQTVNAGTHYADVDVHEVDEINILWSPDGGLRYRFELDGEVTEVAAPASVVIPAGIKHRAEAVAGTGLFLCILLSLPKS